MSFAAFSNILSTAACSLATGGDIEPCLLVSKAAVWAMAASAFVAATLRERPSLTTGGAAAALSVSSNANSLCFLPCKD